MTDTALMRPGLYAPLGEAQPTEIVEKLSHPAMATPHFLDDHVPYRDGASLVREAF